MVAIRATLSPKMAKPQHNWNLAQVLYLQGLTYREICEKVGCTATALNSQIARKKWHGDRKKVASVVSQKSEDIASQLHVMALKEQKINRASDRFLAQLSKHTEAALAQADTFEPPKDRTELFRHMQVIEKCARVGQLAYGLGSNPESTTIAIGLVSPVEVECNSDQKITVDIDPKSP